MNSDDVLPIPIIAVLKSYGFRCTPRYLDPGFLGLFLAVPYCSMAFPAKLKKNPDHVYRGVFLTWVSFNMDFF